MMNGRARIAVVKMCDSGDLQMGLGVRSDELNISISNLFALKVLHVQFHIGF